MNIFRRIWAGLKDRVVGGDYDGPVSIDVEPGPDVSSPLFDTTYQREQIGKQPGKKMK